MTSTENIATALNLSLAEADGYAAYGEDRSAAPTLSPVVRAVIADVAVGFGAAQVFAAFSKGFDRAADDYCAKLMASGE